MKAIQLKDIKSTDQFLEVAENQYQRMHKLRRVWQDENQSAKKRDHAYYLWYIMQRRVINCKNIYAKISQIKPPSGFKPGGTIIQPNYNG